MNDRSIKQQLSELLQKSNAHINLEEVLNQINEKNRGVKLPHLPYTIWQLVEHIRITQQDILDFSENRNYKPMKWPEGYWPKETAPANEQEWENSLQEIRKSLAGFTALITDGQQDLLKPFDYGDGQNLLREAILIIDHLSYHTGQIVLILRLLDSWEG